MEFYPYESKFYLTHPLKILVHLLFEFPQNPTSEYPDVSKFPARRVRELSKRFPAILYKHSGEEATFRPH